MGGPGPACRADGSEARLAQPAPVGPRQKYHRESAGAGPPAGRAARSLVGTGRGQCRGPWLKRRREGQGLRGDRVVPVRLRASRFGCSALLVVWRNEADREAAHGAWLRVREAAWH